MQNDLDLSSIEDRHSDCSVDLQPQQPGSNDSQAHMREILMTCEGERQSGSFEIEEVGKNSQVSVGMPFKGSFLMEMEKLGKTMSFDSTVYNIYEEIQAFSLASILGSEGKQREKMDFHNFEMVDKHLIIDFKKKKLSSFKDKKKSPNALKTRKQSLNYSHFPKTIQSNAQSQQSFRNSSNYSTNKPNYSTSQLKVKKSSGKKKMLAQQSNTYYHHDKKMAASPLKKVRASLASSEIFRSKKSEPESAIQKRKKIAIKFKL